MFIKILPNQIPRLWDNIKYAVSKVDDISEKDQSLYLNRLLHALLSSQAQCIVRINEDRQLLAIGITRLIEDNVTGEKIIFIECLYSFIRTPIDTWKEILNLTMKFAKKEKCSKITAYSSNLRVFEIAKELGFDEYYRYFVMEV